MTTTVLNCRSSHPVIELMFGRMKAASGSAPTLTRSLTHRIDSTDWRAVMDSTQAQSGGFRTPERWNSVPIPARVAQRAYERVEVNEEGCWISTYSVASHGYAQIGWQENGRGRVVLAHRAAWVHVNGQMPLGMTLDHLCKTRRCVNPEHLRVLPNFENARRVNGEDFPLGGCRNGHSNEHLIAVVRRTKAGERRIGWSCGECGRLNRERYQRRHPERYRLVVARSNWRRRHPGEPLPAHLALPDAPDPEGGA